MNFDFGLLVILALGILLGGILFNKKIRIGFFRGLRKFLAGLGSSARAYSAQQRGMGKGKETRRIVQTDEPEVKHIYKQTHHLVKCEKCDGTGKVSKKLPAMIDPKLAGEQTEECPECKGTGKVYD